MQIFVIDWQDVLVDSSDLPTYLAATYQPLLVSGTSIKTINGQSLLGAGNIAISVDLSGYLPIAGGTLTGSIDMDGNSLLNADTVSAVVIDKNGLPVATEAFASSASNLSTGTVADARLSANVTLLGNATTGTGSVVRATSPTLVTPALGVATCTTISGAFLGASGLNFIAGGNGVIVASDKVFGFSNSTNPQGTRDVTWVRNATGPTLETRAAGGLKVCNVDGSAVGPVECGLITSNSTSGGLHIINSAMRLVRNNSSTLLLENGSTGWPLDLSANGPVNVVNAWAGGVPSLGFSTTRSNLTPATRISEASAGVLQIGTTSNNALGSLNLANLTASGVAKFAGYPTGLLPAAASNAGSITYDTTLAKHVGCDGTNWNALW